MAEKYVSALCRELDMRSDYCIPKWQTVYLGGGTPSTLSPQQLQRLFSHIDCSHATEVTIECNPDDVTPAFASLLASLPVNRVSMGAQTFDNSRLRFLRRRHGSDDVRRAVSNLRTAGIDNISIDLIYGFPDETIQQWDDDITAALSLGVEHLSAYCLSYEEGTPLYRLLEEGKVEESDDELTRMMYYQLIDRLATAGYEHYEISNFALPGRRAIHNSNYWNSTPYMGIGAAAHSYDISSRQWNIADIHKYIKEVENGNLPFERESLDITERYNDTVMLSLRTCEGLNLSEVLSRFGSTLHAYLLRQSLQYEKSGLLIREHDRLRLSRQGLYVSDLVITDLLKV
ncbi:MAG: radical SAM family heme chaperone HemW, partial [Prevotella sp.]